MTPHVLLEAWCGPALGVFLPTEILTRNRGKASPEFSHVLNGRTGDWRVVIIDSPGSDRWEMKIFGPNAFERCYMLEGTAGGHEPHTIAALVTRMLPAAR
jgi:hypothetical protein